MIDRDVLAAAVCSTRGRPLWTFLPVPPLPEQERIVQRAQAAARAYGLSLPAFSLTWVDAYGEVRSAGVTVLHADGSLSLWLDANRSPDQVWLTSLHEMRHLADFADARLRRLSGVELEQRAIAFANELAARW